MKIILRAALTVMFCTIMTLCLAPCACAESGDWGNLHWNLDASGQLTISGSGEINSSDENSSSDSFPWSDKTEKIKKAVIEEGITGIGENSFYNCTNMESISIPASMTNIDMHAFNNCWALDAFQVNTNNKNFSDLDGVLFDKSQKIIMKFPEGRTGNYTIPATVAEIGELAFDCSNLKTVIIPNGVESIGYASFFGSKIERITLPDSVTSIGFECFSFCYNLEHINLPGGLQSIPSYAFEECRSLTEITIPDNVSTISNVAFCNCTNLRSVSFSCRVRNIYEQAFENCTSLSKVYYNGRQISWNAILIEEGNDALTNAEIIFDFPGVSGNWGNLNWMLDSNGLLTISGRGEMDTFRVYSDDGSFGIDLRAWHDYSSEVQSILIEEGVTTIGQEAFVNFKNLTSVTLSNTVTVVDEFAFSGCSQLSTIMIPESTTQIGLASFEYCAGLKSVMLPKNIGYISCYAFFECTSLSDIFYSGTGNDWSEVYIDEYNDPLTSASIHYITSADFILPFSLSVISDSAFAGGAFSYVRLSENTATVEKNAFANCPNLKYVFIPSSTTNIAADAFAGVSNLTILGVGGSTAESYAALHGYSFIPIS